MTDWQDSVLDAVRAEAPKPLHLRDLGERLGLTSDADQQALEEAVGQLAADGRLVRVRGKRYALPKDAGQIAGILLGHADGYAFLRQDDAPPDTPDLYIEERNRNGAMHGDRVTAKLRGRGRFGRERGEVLRVLTRAQTRVVGAIRVRRGRCVLIPQDTRLYQPVRIPPDDTGGAVDGQKAVCDITAYPKAADDTCAGRVVEVLGFAGEPGVDTKVLLRKFGLNDEFPDAALAEAERAPDAVSEKHAAGRLDLRELPMVTIDGADAKDLDDAVSLEELPNGNVQLGVHIADVSHYVRPGSALDEEAFARGTSVYLEDLVVPMLPHRLSNGICSLNAGVDRLAMSCLMEVDADGRVVAYDIQPSVIRVDHRMVYDDVFTLLTDARSPLRKQYGDWTVRFEAMAALAQRLREIREARGSLMFDFPEAAAEIDEQGAVCDIVLRETNRAHQLIEEFMLLANETVARHMRDLEAPFVYRNHERPEWNSIERFLDFVQSLGYRVTASEPVTPKDMQAISRKVHGAPEEHLVNTLMLRSLQQARYDHRNAGHFGLASRCYCHFTSPIRRYPDLMVHRLLYLVAERGAESARSRWGKRLGVIAVQCSEQERVGMQAERESLRHKQLLYMAERLGDEFEARITGVKRYGMFVQTMQELAEGLVHVSSLEDDYYEFLEDEHCLEGQRTGRRYRLGDAVSVQVVRVNVEAFELDFRVVNVEPPAKGRARPKRQAARQDRRPRGPKRRPGRGGNPNPHTNVRRAG